MDNFVKLIVLAGLLLCAARLAAKRGTKHPAVDKAGPRVIPLMVDNFAMLRNLAGLLLCAAPLAAQTTTIRLGTLVPKDSPWYELLVKMGDDWNKASGGKIKLDIYPGGEQGDEPEMLQKIRIHKLQAVAISGAGLSSISSFVAGLQIPLMLDSYEELDYVRDKLSPRLEADILKRGFVVLNWGDAGWVHFFTKRPATRPDDIRGAASRRVEHGNVKRLPAA